MVATGQKFHGKNSVFLFNNFMSVNYKCIALFLFFSFYATVYSISFILLPL